MINFSKPFKAIVSGEALHDIAALQITLDPAENGSRIATVYHKVNGKQRSLTIGLEEIDFEQLT